MSRTETTVRELYTFDELSDRAKDAARDWYREGIGQDTDWADVTIEDAVKVCDLLGIQIATHTVKLMGGGSRQDPTIYWQLHTQGSGAAFAGTYSWRKGSVRAIREYAPQDHELHQIAATLRDVQRQHFYRLQARLDHTGRGEHEMSVSIYVENPENDQTVTDAQVDTVTEALRDVMRWIHGNLEKEYEYQNSDAVVDENIRANEYEFTVDGHRA